MRPRTSFWILIALLLMLGLAQIFLRDIGISRLIYLLITLITFSWFLTTRSIEGIKVSRVSREERHQVGQILNQLLEITNSTRLLKFWLSVKDLSGIGIELNSPLLAWLPPKSSRSYNSQTLLLKRGHFSLGPTRIKSGDPFGIFDKQETVKSTNKILVFPYYEKISQFLIPTGYLSGGNPRKDRNIDVTPFSVSVREYQPGDPLKRIDWKSTARLDKLMVKEFEQDPQPIVWVMVDGDKASNCMVETIESNNYNLSSLVIRKPKYSLPKDTFEYAISAAASIIDYFISNNRSIGFCANTQEEITIAPDKSVRQLDKTLETLSLLTSNSEYSISEFLTKQSTTFQKSSTLVIISPYCGLDLIQKLNMSISKGIDVLFIGINPAGFGGKMDNSELIEMIRSNGIKAHNIEFGDNIGEKISLAG